jgi:hypothetical protein
MDSPEGLTEGEAFTTKFDHVSMEFITTMIVDDKLREWKGLGVQMPNSGIKLLPWYCEI